MGGETSKNWHGKKLEEELIKSSPQDIQTDTILSYSQQWAQVKGKKTVRTPEELLDMVERMNIIKTLEEAVLGNGQYDSTATIAYKRLFASPEFKESLASSWFSLFDANEDGEIDAYEFIHGVSIFLKGTPAQRAEAEFHLIDSDGNGSIDKKELHARLTKNGQLTHQIAKTTVSCFGAVAFNTYPNWEEIAKVMNNCFKVAFDEQHTEALVKIIYENADANKDGKITKAEYIAVHTGDAYKQLTDQLAHSLDDCVKDLDALEGIIGQSSGDVNEAKQSTEKVKAWVRSICLPGIPPINRTL